MAKSKQKAHTHKYANYFLFMRHVGTKNIHTAICLKGSKLSVSSFTIRPPYLRDVVYYGKVCTVHVHVFNTVYC